MAISELHRRQRPSEFLLSATLQRRREGIPNSSKAISDDYKPAIKGRGFCRSDAKFPLHQRRHCKHKAQHVNNRVVCNS